VAAADTYLALRSNAPLRTLRQIEFQQRPERACRASGSVARKTTTLSTRFFRLLTLAALVAPCGCAGADETATEFDEARDDGLAGSPAVGDVAEQSAQSEQIAIIEERLNATNTRDWDRWESLHTDDAIRTAPELEAPLHGSAAMRAAIETLSVGFPDYHLELEQAFGQGEWLALRIHTTGTMTGPLMLSDGTEVPPTGQRIEQEWSALVRFDGDHIAEFHEYYDQLTLMVQLGLASP
jgi:predicted ester cyclase